MALVEINGTSLEVEERGSGEPLVFVHGSAGDMRTWDAQIDPFARDFRTIRYSRRFHWPNAKIGADADYSMEQQLDDLRALLRKIDAAPAHLVGHSYGGYLCLLLAIREPHLVRSLVLAEPPVLRLFVSIPPKPAEVLKLLATRPATALAIIQFGVAGAAPAAKAAGRGDLEGGMEIFGKAVLGADAYSRMSAARREQVRANSIASELLRPDFSAMTDDAVRAVAAPTLLLTGQRSPALFHRLAGRLAELLPNARHVEIADASHILQEDNAAAFNSTVLAHLRQTSTPS